MVLEKFVEGSRTALSGRNLVLTGAAAGTVYILMALASFPQYSIQMLGQGVTMLPRAVTALTWNIQASTGTIGLALTLLYAGLAGVAVTLGYLQLRSRNLREAGGLSAATPAVLASGCAGCGAGLLAFMGFAGALASLPFQGNLVRLAGVALLAFFIQRTGRPEICEV